MIGIRADANETVASGHITRCMAIASQLKKLGAKVRFYISDEYPADLLERRGFEFTVLGNDWRDKSGETEMLAGILSEDGADMLLVDSYEADEEYFRKLHRHVRLVYIDDLCRFPCDVDILVNYAVNDCDRIYKGFEDEWRRRYGMPQMLTGLSYTPLREEFAKINKASCAPRQAEYGGIRNIMITTGGSDNNGLTAGIARTLLQKLAERFPYIGLHILEGAFFNESIRRELARLEKMYPQNISVHRNVSNIEDILKNCDIAVSAGGTTLLEICACRMCCICFAVSGNQRPLVEYLARQDAVSAVGLSEGASGAELSLYGTGGAEGKARPDNKRREPEEKEKKTASSRETLREYAGKLAESTAAEVMRIIEDPGVQKRFAQRAGSIVDGMGALRIAQKLTE